VVWWSEWQWGLRRSKIERIRAAMRGEKAEELRGSFFLFFQVVQFLCLGGIIDSKRKVDHEGHYSLLKKAFVSFPS
jgi:hypothetical protein